MRAILLAAGMGTRLRPLTLETPKSLVKVNGKPMLERQVEYLREIGIEEIIVLTGYLNEKFEYLKEKYNVKLVHNDKYDVYNNIYTMYIVREYLKDSYVIDADVYLHKNIFKEKISNSTYFSGYKHGFTQEWALKFDDNNKVYDIEVKDGDGYILSGISYWSHKDGCLIKEKLEEVIENNDFKNLYWDDIVKDNLKELDVYIEKIDSSATYEIDSLEELKEVEELLNKGLI